VGEPLVPVVGRAHEAPVGVLVGLRGPHALPAQRAERGVAVAHRPSRAGPRGLEAEVEVGREDELDVGALGGRGRGVVAVAGVVPRDLLGAVAEHRLALEVDLHRPVHAAQRAQQDVLGVVVGGGAAVGLRALLRVAPRADEQDVAHDDPARLRAPRRLEDVRPRDVAPAVGHLVVQRGEEEAAGLTVEHRAEDAGAVEARQAHPLHVPAGRDEGAGLAVREERVVRDRREGRAPLQHLTDDLLHASSLAALSASL
jgi:hypothetical protein